MSLRKNISYSFVGNAVYTICQWGMLVVLTKLRPLHEVGAFSYGLAVTIPVYMLLGMQLRPTISSDPVGHKHFEHYLSSALLLTSIGFIIVSIMALTINSGYYAGIILACAIGRIVECISGVFHGTFIQHEHFRQLATSSILRGVAALLVFAGALVAGVQLEFAVMAYGFVQFLVIMTYDLHFLRQLEVNFSPLKLPDVRAMLDAALGMMPSIVPLGGVMFLNSVRSNMPKYFVENLTGPEELAVFSALASMTVAGGMFLRAFMQSVMPRLAQNYARGNAYACWKLVAQFSAMAASIGLIGYILAYFAGEFLIELFFTAEYRPYADLLNLLIIFFGLNSVLSILTAATTAFQLRAAQLPLAVVSTLIGALVCLYLIPLDGLMGAGWACIITTIFTIIIYLGLLYSRLSKLVVPIEVAPTSV